MRSHLNCQQAAEDSAAQITAEPPERHGGRRAKAAGTTADRLARLRHVVHSVAQELVKKRLAHISAARPVDSDWTSAPAMQTAPVRLAGDECLLC
jgi:hypothetical protein